MLDGRLQMLWVIPMPVGDNMSYVSNLTDALDSSFESFEGLQEGMLKKLEAHSDEVIGDLFFWSEKRDQVSAGLRFVLDELQKGLAVGLVSLEDAKKWSDRLQVVLDREMELKKLLMVEREKLLHEMRRCEASKKGIDGYTSGAGRITKVFLNVDA